MQVSDQAAIVTGAASGLGAATARTLAARGARVTLLDSNAEGVRAVAAETGGLGLACDVSSSADAEAAVAEATVRHGTARILVNCAGIVAAARIVRRDGPAPLEAFRRVIEVNLVGTFNLIRLVASAAARLEPLGGGERGVVILTASVSAYEGQIGQAAYAASKGGIVGLTLPAARELAAYGIRVCAIAPGLFETPMMKSLPQAVQRSLEAGVPFPKRLGDPAEYAALAMHIIENAMLNGETIRLDGALRMTPE